MINTSARMIEIGRLNLKFEIFSLVFVNLYLDFLTHPTFYFILDIEKHCSFIEKVKTIC